MRDQLEINMTLKYILVYKYVGKLQGINLR